MTLETPPEESEEKTNGLTEEVAERQEVEEGTSREQQVASQSYRGFERRKYFRYNLIYPPGSELKLIIDHREYEVLDISQGGLRFFYDGDIDMGMQIQGMIKFSDDESVAIQGKVVWGKGNEVGMKFDNLLPLFQLSAFQQ